MKRRLVALACLGALGAPASSVTIDWVPIGDPGNPADTAANCVATAPR